jgi:hypothetical protein
MPESKNAVGNAPKADSRRDFLKKSGKQALWMAPTLTLLMTAGATPAKATGGYGNHNHYYSFKKFFFFKKH